jgi:hypothetical protein
LCIINIRGGGELAMRIYDISYFRKDKKTIETKPVKAETMTRAVQKLLDTAKHHGTEISSISATIKGSQGVQRFCDVCLKTEAVYGYKDNLMKCEECRK